MSVTAARLGHSPITLDWSNLSRIPSGSGIGPSAPDRDQFLEVWQKLRGRFERNEVGFYRAVSDSALSQSQESVALASEILATEIFTDCLFLGIGGSALGPISLLSALKDRVQGKIRFHFMENPDPVEWKTVISGLNPAKTLVCAVTKSGTTFETMAQLLCALDWLGKDRWKSHVVAITDPAKGDLKIFAQQQGIRTLHIDPSIGGRFSIFSPVGLFPMALAGLSGKDFLTGAVQIRDFVEKVSPEKNPLFILGHDLIRHFTKRPIHVCMPYSTQLKLLGTWFVQLWAESLGKDGKGFTPLAAVGATDQHSILQLLRDGPDDKVTLFITVDQVQDEVKIPRPLKGTESERLQAFAILDNHSLHELLRVEYRAISLVMTRRDRPHLTFQLDRLDERSLGALYYAFSILTAFTGTLWGVNPFDQPGVEEGKVYIREALTREKRFGTPEPDENSAVARLRREQF
jgi:glucose-6-phosphate isomerase